MTNEENKSELIHTVGQLAEAVELLRKEVKDSREENKEMLEAFRALKGLFVVVTFIGKVAKPIAWIIGVFTAIALYFQGVKIPKITT
jgi:hypothetical protein